jgi:hypothetical protein
VRIPTSSLAMRLDRKSVVTSSGAVRRVVCWILAEASENLWHHDGMECNKRYCEPLTTLLTEVHHLAGGSDGIAK